MALPKKSRKVKRSSRPSMVVNPRRAYHLIHQMIQRLGIHGPKNRNFHPYSESLPDFRQEYRSFSVSYLNAEMFSKFDDEKSSDEKSKTAWERFHLAEDQCSEANKRLRLNLLSDTFFKGQSERSILYTASRKIQGLLGPFSWDHASAYFGFGPGASTRLPRRKGHKVHKYSGRPETTIGNASLAHAAILQKSPVWNDGLEFQEGSGYCEIVSGNRIVTVPKNYKTDRCIAIEPCMNMYIQKGLGGLIRRKLRSVGVDLNDQKKNQRLALIGSLSGLLATIDLSMASDTVPTELVRQLLPEDWLDALEQCRSHSGTLPSGERIAYQKFSSMGNGFTFELESLIFWALCSAVYDVYGIEDRRLAVYGDDIIVSSASVPHVINILSFCGFTTNDKKTHVSGPFRESCGKHYLSGNDVSPFYVKRFVNSLSDLFLLHNNVYRWSARCVLSLEQLLVVKDVLQGLKDMAPRNWRKPRIPDGVGDGAFIGTFDECTPTLSFEFSQRGYEGYTVRVLAQISAVLPTNATGQLVAALDDCSGSNPWLSKTNYLNGKRGGVPGTPRTREVMTHVVLFPGEDHFSSVSVF